MKEVTLEKAQKVGNWISALLLSNTRELIARIDERTTYIQKDVDHMRMDLSDVRHKVNDISPKVDVLWKERVAPSHSPRQLNQSGLRILEQSGIRRIIDQYKSELLARVRGRHPTDAYVAEQAALEMVNRLQEFYPDIVDKLRDGAFRSGEDIGTVLLVGGIYLRNEIFPELGFTIDDIDRSPAA